MFILVNELWIVYLNGELISVIYVERAEIEQGDMFKIFFEHKKKDTVGVKVGPRLFQKLSWKVRKFNTRKQINDIKNFTQMVPGFWTLCGLVVSVPGYRSRGPGFDSRCYQIFWEVVGLERGPLSLVRIIEELLEWEISGSGQENRINDRGDLLRRPRDTLYP
jgi:hypothetical protein